MVNVNKHVREEAKQRFKQILLDGAFPEIDYKVTENGYTQKLQNIAIMEKLRSGKMSTLREISELENKILHASKGDIIRVCMYCNNLIGEENKKIPITDFQKKYLKENYHSQLSHGIDIDCYEEHKRSEEE